MFMGKEQTMQLKRTMLLACTTMAVGACTGDAAMDASLGSVLGSTAAFVTGDYDLAGQFATQGQHFYSMGQTGDYVYDAETAQSWTGTSSGSSTSTANQPGESGASGGNADTMEAVSSAVSLDYPASMGDLGPNIMAARPSSPCPADLSYLDSILPHTSDMELERTRANLLAADMTEAHFSPPEHVVQALDASDAFRQTADELLPPSSRSHLRPSMSSNKFAAAPIR
jgi:hypothetical protein